MSSSDDDTPLVKANGRSTAPASDVKMPDAPSTNGHVDIGKSIQNGQQEDTEMPDANSGKRRSRASTGRKTYAEPESSEDDQPLSKRRRTSVKQEDPESDDDVPLAANKAAQKKNAQAFAKNAQTSADAQGRNGRKSDTSKTTKAPAANNKKQVNGVKKEPVDDTKPTAKRAPAKPKAEPKVKSEPKSAQSTPVKKGSAKATPVKKEESEEAEEPEEEEYRWWEDPAKGDGTIKWTTLEHNGVVFPPPYEPLPKDVKMKYDGIPITLHPDAEEVASFFGGMLNSTHNVENPTFQKNFFGDFKDIIKKTGGAKDPKGNKIDIKEFSKCDFQPIFAYYDMKRQEKKNLPQAEKKRQKAEKDEQEAPFMYCIWDGRKQKVGNFRVEPPSLFRGRGEHPKTGHVKTRVQPEQITINIGKDAPVPPPPEGHRWKEVKHDQEGTWLAMWQENINGNYKYVMLAANSDVKGQSDFKKFEKARELKHYIGNIRKDYQKNLKHELMVERQKATAVYLIDHVALRAGNEKGDDEAETVGCCSLKYENVTLKPPNKVVFDFLGKDSIRFCEEFEVDPQVFKNLKIFKKPPKKEGDEIFDRLTTSALNKHLSAYMPGLTAKVFRTYNASHTMGELLKDMKATGNNAEKVKSYNDANRKVAILCNHKRTVGATHASSMEKMSERIKGLRYQKWRLKQQMLDLDPSLKKKKGAKYFEIDEDIDLDWIKEHQAFLIEEQKQKIQKKFEKDNEKLVADGEKEMKASELEERMGAAKELEKKYNKENKTGKVEAEGRSPSVDKIEAAVQKLEQRIDTMEVQAKDKEDNKEVALGTSKINYIDPRLTVVFSKKFDVPIEKFFSKALREKFEWAIKSVDGDWEF